MSRINRFVHLATVLGAIGATQGTLASPADGGERKLEPLSATCFATPDARTNARCTLATVPAGKRMVVTSTSYFASSSSPVVRAALIFAPNIINLPIPAPVSNPATGTLYITGLNISFIVDENTPVEFFMFGTNRSVEATLHGYLVDK